MGNSESAAEERVQERITNTVNTVVLNVLHKNTTSADSVVNVSNEMSFDGIVVGSKIGDQNISTQVSLDMLIDNKINDKVNNEMTDSVTKELMKQLKGIPISNTFVDSISNTVTNTYSTVLSKENVVKMINSIYASNKISVGGLLIGSEVGNQNITSNIVMKISNSISSEVLNTVKKNNDVYQALIEQEKRSRKIQLAMFVSIIIILLVILVITIVVIIKMPNSTSVTRVGTLVSS